MNSIVLKFEGAEKSTMAWIEKELLLVEGKEPTIERVIDAGLTYLGPVLVIGLTAIGEPAIAAVVAPVIAKAHQDLLVASALVTDLGPTPNAAALFESVQTNLSGLLTAGNIKSTKTVTAITKAVSEIGTLGSAVKAAAAQVAAAALPPAPLPAAA